MATPSFIEPLETRIAPATFVNAFAVTYVDVDGDLVKVKSSLPIFQKDLQGFTFTPSGEGEKLSFLVLGTSASGASIGVKVSSASETGNGTADVGGIHAQKVDLASVMIDGNLETIRIGNGDAKIPGIGTLHVGRFGTSTDSFGALVSEIRGGAGSIRIEGDLSANRLDVEGHLGHAFIGGNLIGGNDDAIQNPGSLSVSRSIGTIKVAGNLVGGSSSDSGTIHAKSIGSIKIEGSILGGEGYRSGMVLAFAQRSVGSTNVVGDIVGGAGDYSGSFHANGSANGGITGEFKLGGSVIGGSGDGSGSIALIGTGEGSGKLRVHGDVQGGEGDRSGEVLSSAATITVNQSVLGGSGRESGIVTGGAFTKQVRIGMDLVGGTGARSGAVAAAIDVATDVLIGGDVRGVLTQPIERFGDVYTPASGSISGDYLGTVRIGGSIIAAERAESETHVTSYAVLAFSSITNLYIGGSINGTPTNSIGITGGALPSSVPLQQGVSSYGIQAMNVQGSVAYAEISAGFVPLKFFFPKESRFNPDARIGALHIHGDLTASSVTAGIHPGEDLQFGTADDYAEVGEPTEIRSRIASIIVGGQVTGTADNTDAFAVAAQRIVAMTIGGAPVPLTSANDTIQLAPQTNDVLLREHL